MSYSHKLRRGLKQTKRPKTLKRGTPDRRVTAKGVSGPFEWWMHATKGLRVERRHAS